MLLMLVYFDFVKVRILVDLLFSYFTVMGLWHHVIIYTRNNVK